MKCQCDSVMYILCVVSINISIVLFPFQNSMPGMDLTGDIWVETKTGEGKSYFYNARTRETTWTKPEGPTVKVITQEQV